MRWFFATIIAAIYVSRKIGTGAKKIEDLETKIEDLETRLVDLSSKMRQAAAESAEELENSIENSMRKFGHGMGQMLQNMQWQLADLVEEEGGQLLQTS